MGPRRVALFSAQFGDLSLADLCALARRHGYGGVELGGAHLEVRRAAEEPGYAAGVRATLGELRLEALSCHGPGQCVGDAVDARHQAIVPAHVWGEGEPEKVRRRAVEEVLWTGRAAKALGVSVVVGFTGSSIWPFLSLWPPVPAAMIDEGYKEFARRWTPILGEYQALGVRFALEVHPTEIAYDFETTRRALAAVSHHPAFCLNVDPSHFIPQMLSPDEYVREFGDRVVHVHIKDAALRLNGQRSVLGGHLPFGHPGRGWDFRSPGRGDVDFEALIRALNDVGYTGPLSVEWEDNGMEREWGIADAKRFVDTINFAKSSISFEETMTGNK